MIFLFKFIYFYVLLYQKSLPRTLFDWKVNFCTIFFSRLTAFGARAFQSVAKYDRHLATALFVSARLFSASIRDFKIKITFFRHKRCVNWVVANS